MPLDIPRIKALCFDVDGTLSDTDDLWVSRLAGLLKPVKWLLPGRDACRTARGWIMAAETPSNFFYRLADQLHLDDDLVRIMSRKSLRERKHAVMHLIIPGIIDLLTTLGRFYPMSVVSARDESSTLDFLDHFGLTPMFSVIVTSQTCEYTKPFPDPVLYAARQMGVPPQNCLMIGDTTVDIKAGKNAGGQTAGVLCGFGYEKELRSAGADTILDDTCRIAKLLLNDQSTLESI